MLSCFSSEVLSISVAAQLCLIFATLPERVCSHHPGDAAIIEALLTTAMRLSELAKLTLSDVEIPKRITRDPDNTGSVRVTRKGRKTQLIPLNYKACQALDAYLKIRPEVDHEALFVTKFKEPMSPRAIQYRVQKYFIEAGIKGASVHTLRHTMGRPFGRLVNISLDMTRNQRRVSSPWRSSVSSHSGLVSFQGT
jgi:site-specific recombinase XerD